MSETIYVYVAEKQKEEWKKSADTLNMSLSKYAAAMAEAGRKEFSRSMQVDETRIELRQQRNDLRNENQRLRKRITKLEGQVGSDERETVKQYIRKNPGVDFDSIVQQLINSVPSRTSRHIGELLGEAVREEDGKYYPLRGDS